MSDTEVLRIRVRVQRALASLSEPRSDRSDADVMAALAEISAALRELSPV